MSKTLRGRGSSGFPWKMMSNHVYLFRLHKHNNFCFDSFEDLVENPSSFDYHYNFGSIYYNESK